MVTSPATPLGPIATGDQRLSLVKSDLAECHRLLNGAGVPGNHGSQERLPGRVRWLIATLNEWRRVASGEYNFEMVEKLLRLASERPAATFDNFEDMMKWLDEDGPSTNEGQGSPVVRSEEGNETGQKSSPPVPSVGEEEIERLIDETIIVHDPDLNTKEGRLFLARAVLAALPQHGWQEERERCAKLADAVANKAPKKWSGIAWSAVQSTAEEIAAAIRALPPPPAKE